MKQVDVGDVARRAAELLAAAESGERIEIMRDGERVAAIIPPADLTQLELDDWYKGQLSKRAERLGRRRRDA